MVTTRTKKVAKYRAHTTHGGGHRKKRRGAGSRGGRGNAGSGKRASHKQRVTLTGRSGFIPRRTVKSINSVNVSYFTPSVVEKLITGKKAVKEGDVYTINLSQLKYDKLLGTGKVSLKLKLIVNQFSARAEEKVKSAGGEIISAEDLNKEGTKSEK